MCWTRCAQLRTCLIFSLIRTETAQLKYSFDSSHLWHCVHLLHCSHSDQFLSTLLGKQGFLEVLPENAKQDTLQTIGKDLGFQSSEKETTNATLLQDGLDDLGIRKLIRVRLLVDLDDANRVGAGIRNGRRAKTQNGSSPEFRELRVLFGDLFRQEIVSGKPTIIIGWDGVERKETWNIVSDNARLLILVSTKLILALALASNESNTYG